MRKSTLRDVASQQNEVTNNLRRYARLLNFAQPMDMSNRVKEMIAYIHDHLFEPSLTLEKIQSECNAKNHNITTEFRRVMGVGIWQYVIRARLRGAVAVLSKHKVNIYVLATAVGYTEEAFSRAFKNRYGCSPMQYHKKQVRDDRTGIVFWSRI